MIQKTWARLSNRFPHVQLDEFIVMPNHLHGIISIVGANPRVRPNSGDDCANDPNHGRTHGSAPTVGRMIQWYKTMTTNYYIHGVRNGIWKPFDGKLWQRNYYEHVIRTENDLNQIRQYIRDNAAKWEMDPENPTV